MIDRGISKMPGLAAENHMPLQSETSLTNTRLRFDLDTEASEEQLATLYKLTERYCVVYQTLNNAPPIIFET